MAPGESGISRRETPGRDCGVTGKKHVLGKVRPGISTCKAAPRQRQILEVGRDNCVMRDLGATAPYLMADLP